MRVQGRVVHLAGFTGGDPHTVRLSDPGNQVRIDLLVLAPATDPVVARRALMLASATDSGYRAAEILDGARDRSAASS
jgi:hypothetical protein